MFVTNYESLNNEDIVWVAEKTKNYLVSSFSYCPISYNKETEKWAFPKTLDLLEIVLLMEGGNDG